MAQKVAQKVAQAFGASVNGGFSVASGTAHLWATAQRNVTEGPAFFLGAVDSSNRAKRALGFAFLNLAQAQSAMRNPAPKKGGVKKNPHGCGWGSLARGVCGRITAFSHNFSLVASVREVLGNLCYTSAYRS